MHFIKEQASVVYGCRCPDEVVVGWLAELDAVPLDEVEVAFFTVSRRVVAVAGKRFWLVAVCVVFEGVVADNPVETLLPLLGGADELLDEGGGPSQETTIKTVKHKKSRLILRYFSLRLGDFVAIAVKLLVFEVFIIYQPHKKKRVFMPSNQQHAYATNRSA